MHKFSDKKCIRCGVRETKKNGSSYCKVPTLGCDLKDRWLGHNYVLRKRWEERWANDVRVGEEERQDEGGWLGCWRSHC